MTSSAAAPVWLDQRYERLFAGTRTLLGAIARERKLDPDLEELWAVEHRLVVIAATSSLSRSLSPETTSNAPLATAHLAFSGRKGNAKDVAPSTRNEPVDDKDRNMEDTLKDLWAEAVRNSVWASRPISQEPSVVIVRWRIVQLPDGDRHCVGRNVLWTEGRVSSPIVKFDPTTMRAVSRSGRVYQMEGPSGWDPDAEYVLSMWLGAQGLTVEDVVDVTNAMVNHPSTPSTSSDSLEDDESTT